MLPDSCQFNFINIVVTGVLKELISQRFIIMFLHFQFLL